MGPSPGTWSLNVKEKGSDEKLEHDYFKFKHFSRKVKERAL